MRIADTLLIRFGLVRKKESDEAIKVFRGMADRDSTLAATLVDKCRRLQQDNDALSDENAKLTEENERVAGLIREAELTAKYERWWKEDAFELVRRVYHLLTEDPRQPGTGAAKAYNEILEFWRENEDEEEDG